MNQLCILFAVFSVSLAAPSYESTFSGIHPSIGGRIVGGDEADIRDLPYQAALLRNGAQICGAIIVSDETILTAAHCVAPSVISNINQLSFRVGSSQWRSGGQQIFAQEIKIHELYQDCEDCPPDYDIAVIKLRERIRVPNAIPVPLAPANRRYTADLLMPEPLTSANKVPISTEIDEFEAQELTYLETALVQASREEDILSILDLSVSVKNNKEIDDTTGYSGYSDNSIDDPGHQPENSGGENDLLHQ